MKVLRCFPIALLLVLVLLLASAPPAIAQSNADTLRYGLFGNTSRSVPTAFIRGGFVQQVLNVRSGPDSAPASTATADSVLLPAIALQGYTARFQFFGTASASNAKSVVITFTAAGATTTIDSLQMKTGGGRWASYCTLMVRNAVPTGDSTQVLYCTHTGSADSSTTSSATPLTTTVKMVPGQALTNAFKVHNATGTAKGDVIVQLIVGEALPGGRVNQ